MTKKISTLILILFIAYGGFTVKAHIDTNDTYFLYKELLTSLGGQHEALKVIPTDAQIINSTPSFSSHEKCVVIQDRTTYKKYKKEFGESFCQRCEEIQFTKHMLIGMPFEDVITDPKTTEGIDKYAFLDHQSMRLHFFILPERHRTFTIDPLLIFKTYAHAAYLAPDDNWLVRIPAIPEGYAIECSELDYHTFTQNK